jgi:hypothetical protein
MTATLDPEAPSFVQPSYVYEPPRVSSMLPWVKAVCESLLHEELEPEQERAIEVLTGRRQDGVPASLSAAVICARQNLKTYILERIILTLLLEPNSDIRLLLWTSQQLTTCDETFEHFVQWFEGRDPVTNKLLYPDIAKRLKNIDRGKGDKQIEMVDGKRLKFKARSPKSGQGLTGDVVVFDEAFALEHEHLAALIPTLSTRRRAMIFYGSSAAHEYSEVLRGVTKRGRKGGQGAPAYIEWCAPGSFDEPGCDSPECLHIPDTEGCVLDRPNYIQAANPMAGRRITWEYLRQERLELAPDEFARERLGWEDNALDDLQPINPELWEALGKKVETTNVPMFFISCSPNLRSATIAGATFEGGVPHVKLAHYRAGTHWLKAEIERLREKYPKAQWQFELGGPASALASYNELLDCWEFGADDEVTAEAKRLVGEEPYRGVVIKKPFSSIDMARGCVHLQKLCADGRMSHSGDQMLQYALRNAVKRDIGDPGLWAWGRRKSNGDIDPLVAATGALWFLESNRSGNFFFSKR